ncbi:MAG: response regulator [Bacteroidota bacterium]|nr:response regulator [Ferruginibacter sp.]
MRKTPSFFLADDDVDDQMLFVEALSEINTSIHCTLAKNGEEALTLLRDYPAPLPDFIFLDLNMPRMSGIKCLAELKKIESLKTVPVIIYSTSSQKEYIDESLKLGAQNFFVKPSNFNGLLDYLQGLVSETDPGLRKF